MNVKDRLNQIDHHTGDYVQVPYSFRTVCGFFNVPQIISNKYCETGSTVYRPYPRRLDSLNVCRYGDVQQCREFLSINLETTLVVQSGYERRKLASLSEKCYYTMFTRQLAFANASLHTLVFRVNAPYVYRQRLKPNSL